MLRFVAISKPFRIIVIFLLPRSLSFPSPIFLLNAVAASVSTARSSFCHCLSFKLHYHFISWWCLQVLSGLPSFGQLFSVFVLSYLLVTLPFLASALLYFSEIYFAIVPQSEKPLITNFVDLHHLVSGSLLISVRGQSFFPLFLNSILFLMYLHTDTVNFITSLTLTPHLIVICDVCHIYFSICLLALCHLYKHS